MWIPKGRRWPLITPLFHDQYEREIVGIEGGEHPAFREPPMYDPKAMQHERVIIAAFNTAPSDELPRENASATIHLEAKGMTRCNAIESPDGSEPGRKQNRNRRNLGERKNK